MNNTSITEKIKTIKMYQQQIDSILSEIMIELKNPFPTRKERLAKLHEDIANQSYEKQMYEILITEEPNRAMRED
jgi:hypothetical protein